MEKGIDIKFETYEDYRDKYNHTINFQTDFSLMECTKEVAEQILNTEIEDVYDSNIRCVWCGSNKVFKKFSSNSVGFFKRTDKGLIYYVEEIPKNELHFDSFECADCGETITYDDLSK